MPISPTASRWTTLALPMHQLKENASMRQVAIISVVLPSNILLFRGSASVHELATCRRS